MPSSSSDHAPPLIDRFQVRVPLVRDAAIALPDAVAVFDGLVERRIPEHRPPAVVALDRVVLAVHLEEEALRAPDLQPRRLKGAWLPHVDPEPVVLPEDPEGLARVESPWAPHGGD